MLTLLVWKRITFTPYFERAITNIIIYVAILFDVFLNESSLYFVHCTVYSLQQNTEKDNHKSAATAQYILISTSHLTILRKFCFFLTLYLSYIS